MSSLKNSFKPAWWCRGAHVQTISGAFLKPKKKLALKRKRLEIPDGDFLDMDYLESIPKKKDRGGPCVVIVHGLEGSSESPYVQSLLMKIHERGWNAVAVNMRMCSREPNRLKETYHSGRSDDLDWVLETLGHEYEPENLFLVGYSIGGNIVLKWLGEQNAHASTKIKKAAAVSVPYMLSESVKMLATGFNREVYTRSLLSSLKKKVQAKEKKFPNAIRYEKVKACNTFQEFDREVTAPLNDFESEEEYWEKSSSKHYLRSISLPTLLIHAEDDPFFPGHLLPLDEIESSKYLEPLFVPHGGHVGFVAGTWPWKQELWLEESILSFLAKDSGSF